MPGDDTRAGESVVVMDNGSALSAALRGVNVRVNDKRQARCLTLRDAAAEIGMQYADLCRFEKGHLDVRLSTLLKITDWLEAD